MNKDSWKKSGEFAHEALKNSGSVVAGLGKLAGNTSQSLYYLIDGIDKFLGSLDKKPRGRTVDWIKHNSLKGIFALSSMVYSGDKIHDYVNQNYPDIKENITWPVQDDIVAGVDISQYNDFNLNRFLENNYQKVADGRDDTRPFEFIILRASMGDDIDIAFKDRWKILHNYNEKSLDDADLILGAYHYYRPNQHSADQFHAFSQAVDHLSTGSIAPILDIEKLPTVQSVDKMRKGLKNWLRLAEEKYDTQPMIYTGQSFYNDYIYPDLELRQYPVWIAHYNNDEHSKLDDYVIHQIMEDGNVPGANVKNGGCDVNNALRGKLDKVRVK